MKLRIDFAEEMGVLARIQELISESESGAPNPGIKSLVPANLTKSQYVQMAAWALLPDRISYKEVILPGATEPCIMVSITRETALCFERSELWDTMLANARDAAGVSSGLLPFQLEPLTRPAEELLQSEYELLHDLKTGAAAIAHYTDISKSLHWGLRWNVTANA